VSAPGPQVLVIEDEPQIRRFLKATLGARGYRVLEAPSGEEGATLAASHNPDVVLLDLGLPDIDGLEVVKRIREWSPMPIVVLSARGMERDKVAALDLGADDYVTKPFSVQELAARVRAALRRAALSKGDGETPVVAVGDLEIDVARHVVTVRGKRVRLTPTEFRLLATLARHAGRVCTHRFLLEEVWGSRNAGQTHYLRIYMRQLRNKIEESPARPRYLLTEMGVGYRLVDE
jgi:two-component system KDP operon response regulator KdpE